MHYSLRRKTVIPEYKQPKHFYNQYIKPKEIKEAIFLDEEKNKSQETIESKMKL